MKVLHISRQFYPCIGGTERYIFEVAKRLVKRGVSCRILTLNYNIFQKKEKFKKYEKIDSIEIYRVSGWGYYKKPIPLNLPLNLFKWADIVHLHDVRFLFETSIFLKKFFKYKIVYSTHGFIFHTHDLNLLKKFIVPLYYKPVISKFIDGIICVSLQDYKFFKNITKNVFLIENGIDYEKFSNILRKPVYGEFLYFGRIDVNKGLDLLFYVLSNLKEMEWRLNIVGSGFVEIVNGLKNLAKNLKIDDKIIWWGFLSEEKLFDLISISQLCFFPSTYEGFGFTLVEAMAAGCICVANKIQSYCNIVEDGKNGFLVNFSDILATTNRIKAIINLSNSYLYEISNNAKTTAQRYNWEEKISQIINVYQKIL